MKDTPSPDEFRFFLSKHGLTGREAGALVGRFADIQATMLKCLMLCGTRSI